MTINNNNYSILKRTRYVFVCGSLSEISGWIFNLFQLAMIHCSWFGTQALRKFFLLLIRGHWICRFHSIHRIAKVLSNLQDGRREFAGKESFVIRAMMFRHSDPKKMDAMEQNASRNQKPTKTHLAAWFLKVSRIIINDHASTWSVWSLFNIFTCQTCFSASLLRSQPGQGKSVKKLRPEVPNMIPAAMVATVAGRVLKACSRTGGERNHTIGAGEAERNSPGYQENGKLRNNGVLHGFFEARHEKKDKKGCFCEGFLRPCYK